MGEVYKAFDPTLQRTVAVKTVRRDVNDPTVRDRLYREAQACGRLQHPNIVTVYEAGEIDGIVFIAMEYLRGENLGAALKRGWLSFDARIKILIQILDALQYAHGEQVIHRDIKPSNVHLMPDGSSKLLDFGLARVMHADTLTLSGAIIGTPYYASPEQLRGEHVEHHTDIYSTGSLAYEMLTGRHPFEGDSVAAVVLKVVSEPPPPMDTRWSQAFPGIQHIILRAMAKPVDARYASAEEMKNALIAFLDSSREAIAAAQADGTVLEEDPAFGNEDQLEHSSTPPSCEAVHVGRTLQAHAEAGWPPTAPQDFVEPGSPAEPPTPWNGQQSNLSRKRSKWSLAAVFAVIVVTMAAVLTLRSGIPRPSTMPAGTANLDPRSDREVAGHDEQRPRDQDEQQRTETRASYQTGTSQPRSSDSGTSPVVTAAPRLMDSVQRPGDASTPLPNETFSAKTLFYADKGASLVSTLGKSLDVKGSGGPENIRAAANAGLKYRIVQRVLADGKVQEVEVDPNTTFHTGDQVRLTFESNIDGYLYIVQLASSGRWTLLFPDSRINEGANSVRRFERYVIPPEKDVFGFNSNAGTERLFVFLSKTPVTQLPGLDKPVTTFAEVDQSVVDELRHSVNERDLVLAKESVGSSAADKPPQAMYVVNRHELAKAVALTIQLVHEP